MLEVGSRRLAVLWCGLVIGVGCSGSTAERPSNGVDDDATSVTPSMSAQSPPVIVVDPDRPLNGTGSGSGALNRALSNTTGPVQFELRPGHYVLDPVEYTDPTCGNCEDPAEPVPATVGARVTGRNVTIFGSDPDSVVIHTRAGYGLLFDACEDCVLRGVTVTGGSRDPDPRATNGGVVVRQSSLILQRCAVSDNVGSADLVRDIVVGISGVVGREGSRIALRTCRITGNSWDGVALYRDAEAQVRGAVIDGVDRATGSSVGGGRGVGIGATWNARVVVEETRVARYWKGIGVFGEAHAQIRENVVEEMATWGIAVWGDGRSPSAFVEDNVVYRTGACGILVDVGSPGDGAPAPAGAISRNALVETALDERYDDGDPYCPQQPIARVRVPESWPMDDNLFHANRRGGAPGDEELDLETFLARAMRLYTFEIEPQAATTDSFFMQAFAEDFGPPFR